MSWTKNVEALLTVIEAKSFNKAAEQLYTTPSSISKRVTALEEKLKVQLLKRSNHGLIITDVGKQFYEAAKPIWGEWEALIAQFTDQDNKLNGSLRLGIPYWSCDRFINTCVAKFLKLHPEIKVDIKVANLFGPPTEEKCDLVFSAEDSYGKAYSYLVRKKILTMCRRLYAAPEFLKNKAPIKKISDLLNYNCLARKQVGYAWELNGEFITVSGNYKSDDGDALLQLAVAGAGILYAPPILCLEELKTKRLVQILPTYQSKEYCFYAYYEKKRYTPKIIKEFLDTVLADANLLLFGKP